MISAVVRVVAPHFVAGMEMEDDVIVRAAPILKWAVGKNRYDLRKYFSEKGWKASVSYDLPVEYGLLSLQERREVRRQYQREQDGKCMYCGAPLDDAPPASITRKPIRWTAFPNGFLNHPVHLQHDHQTGLTEGAVHAYCNAVMWQYEGR